MINKISNQYNQLDMTNEVCKNKSLHVKNEIKYSIVRGSQHGMRIVKQNNLHVKINGLYNNDKIIGVKVNRMSKPQEASDITKCVNVLTNQY